MVGRPPNQLAATASGLGSLTNSGRVLWWEGLVLREPGLCEDGVVGGEDGREEGGQDKEEVQQGRSPVRGINLKMKIRQDGNWIGFKHFSLLAQKKNTFAPFIDYKAERHHDNHIIPMTSLWEAE